jgi:hypothetical protein
MKKKKKAEYLKEHRNRRDTVRLYAAQAKQASARLTYEQANSALQEKTLFVYVGNMQAK